MISSAETNAITTLSSWLTIGGLRSRNDFQAIRLALRDAIVTGRALSPNRAEYLVNRYNLIQTPAEVRTLLRATLANSDLYDQFVDDSLWTGTN